MTQNTERERGGKRKSQGGVTRIPMKNKETEPERQGKAAHCKQCKERSKEGKKRRGEDSDALTEEDRKKETVYSRDIQWGRGTAIQTHSVQKHGDVQSYLLSLHTTVHISAAVCQYIIIPQQEEPGRCCKLFVLM